MARRSNVVFLAMLLAGPAVVRAQGAGGAAAPSRNACLDALPDSLLRPVPVYLTARLVDSARFGHEIGNSVDLFTQSVAEAARALLSSRERDLPDGEPAITWRGLDAPVLVTARRDGSVTASVKPPERRSDVATSEAGGLLLLRAIDTLRARGELVPIALGDPPPDSVSWRLTLVPTIVGEDGTVAKPKLRVGHPVFTTRVPAQRHVSVERVIVRYPRRLSSEGFTGKVLMEFLVDTTGRPVVETIRDVLPSGMSPLNDRERTAYDEFVGAIRAALAKGRFRPARIGGCVVRELVRQPFNFMLDG